MRSRHIEIFADRQGAGAMSEQCPAALKERERDGSTLPTEHGWFAVHIVPWPYFTWPLLRRSVSTCLYCGKRREALRPHERLARKMLDR